MKTLLGLDVSAARSAADLARLLELVLADSALSLPRCRLSGCPRQPGGVVGAAGDATQAGASSGGRQ
jgi:hypothetical protein